MSRLNDKGTHAAILCSCLVVTAAVYHRALGTFFARDDITFLSRAAGLERGEGPFRLVSGLAFRLEHALFGLDARGFHVVNLALHLLNVTGVYALAAKLEGRRSAAGAAATLFGVSSIAFTPLHWAAGLVELLPCAFLLSAALLHLGSHRRGWVWRWAAALLALLAMFAKETAVMWVFFVVLLEWRAGRTPWLARDALPAAMASLVFASVFVGSGQIHRFEASEAYARTTSPLFLAENLFTYLKWCVALGNPIRDRVAAVDPGAWRVALPLVVAVAAALRGRDSDAPLAVEIGLGWWLLFLIPVLPLAHHTYLYYLYIPWAGGAIGAAALGRRLLDPWPRTLARSVGCLALAGVVGVEAHAIRTRESKTQDALPVDPTLREAMLLSHALPALRAAGLKPGARVAFVNPVPRPRFDLMTGAPTRPEDAPNRTSYLPLEAAMRGGETLRLFLPQVVYLGFATTIPPDWEGAECFYYEQRGWLKYWGHGQSAWMRQAQVQVAARRWTAAESTLLRVRALGDTVPGALEAQVAALAGLGRETEARAIARELVNRWPHRPLAPDTRAFSSIAPQRTPDAGKAGHAHRTFTTP